ncbi:MAG: hypothetical protein V1797_09160 [Pseudomonadota bacterium]
MTFSDEERKMAQEILEIRENELRMIKAISEYEPTFNIQKLYEEIMNDINHHETQILPHVLGWESWWDDRISGINLKAEIYHTSEEENAVDWLEYARDSLVKRNTHYWKHLLVGLHGSIYGLAISALGSSNPDLVTDKRGLFSIKKALENLCKGKYLTYICGTPICFSLEINAAINKLVAFRNDFIHFSPKGWTIITNGLPLFCTKLLKPIFIIAFEMWGVKDQSRQLRILSALRDISNRLLEEHARMFVSGNK